MLSQDGDLASRLCQRLCLVLRGDDGGSAMSKRARWILWLCCRSITVFCACNLSLEVQDLSSMAALFSLSLVLLSPCFVVVTCRFVLLGPLCLEPLVSHCSMFSVYMASSSRLDQLDFSDCCGDLLETGHPSAWWFSWTPA
ncbi:hypothetical protein Bca52824_066568 [Brassica carinata]|uniref:Uncharacterized protein n=1 Tax=Brassica carinata TaxID=52824 RepID=A0A8X7QQR5_BRACI|nr:hypothetical protein Bca52824_066568 [Brassica carinata]